MGAAGSSKMKEPVPSTRSVRSALSRSLRPARRSASEDTAPIKVVVRSFCSSDNRKLFFANSQLINLVLINILRQEPRRHCRRSMYVTR